MTSKRRQNDAKNDVEMTPKRPKNDVKMTPKRPKNDPKEMTKKTTQISCQNSSKNRRNMSQKRLKKMRKI